MSQLPSGTVTFLFTDIEGSTGLWQQNQKAMTAALARHDDILRGTIQTEGGYVFKTIGDAFCAAFATAPEAVRAVLSAQRALIAESWPETGPLRVRMALHTGAAQERDGDYFGPPLNRVARLLSTGHGGQVLLSLATQELVRDNLTDNCTLKHLGDHRLRDLVRAETVAQLVHPDLPSEFPPLKSLDNLPNNLPVQLTSFVGREKELEEIKKQFVTTRLLTLAGIGGIGKTRLELQVGADLLEEFPDGVWFVDLQALTDSNLVGQAVATVLGVREQPNRPVLTSLVDHAQNKTLLVLLDNCEQLMDGCARVTDALLKGCPKVKILATSRERLGIAGETLRNVSTLTAPGPSDLPPAQNMEQYDAVKLFIERARAVQPDFQITNENAPAVAQICWRLDGIALAIELAAARVRMLTPEQIVQRLDDRFRLLTGGSRTAMPRQQTLRQLIDWSYNLLSEPERLMFGRLAIFAGGWTLEAAEAVCGGDGIESWEVFDLLTSLVDKSLVSVSEVDGNKQTRYRLLETIRQYAREKLESSMDAEKARGRHREFFLQLAERAGTQLAGPEQGSWLQRLEIEHDNLRSVLEWTVINDVSLAVRLARAIWRFWELRGHWREGLGWVEQCLSGKIALTPDLRAAALDAAGNLAACQGDSARAKTLFEEQLALQEQLGDERGIADALHNLGAVAWRHGDYGQARANEEKGLAIRRKLGDKSAIATSLHALGTYAQDQNDLERAAAFYQEALAIRRDLGDLRSIASVLNNMGTMPQDDVEKMRAVHEESLAIRRKIGDKAGISQSLTNLAVLAEEHGDFRRAHALLEEGLAIDRELGNKKGVAASLRNYGELMQLQGEFAKALIFYQQSLTLFQELRDKLGITACIEGFAMLAGLQSESNRAAQMFGIADAFRGSLGTGQPVSFSSTEYDRQVAATRAQLDKEAFTTAWSEGRGMSTEQAIAFALEKL